MSFNVSKCVVMHVGKKNIRYTYKMNVVDLSEVKEEKDLGVWMEEDMRPSKQCKMAAQSVNWALGQLSRAFHYRKASSLVPLYNRVLKLWSYEYKTEARASGCRMVAMAGGR